MTRGRYRPCPMLHEPPPPSGQRRACDCVGCPFRPWERPSARSPCATRAHAQLAGMPGDLVAEDLHIIEDRFQVPRQAIEVRDEVVDTAVKFFVVQSAPTEPFWSFTCWLNRSRFSVRRLSLCMLSPASLTSVLPCCPTAWSSPRCFACSAQRSEGAAHPLDRGPCFREDFGHLARSSA